MVLCQKTGSAVIVPLHKSKGERIECRNYRYMSPLSVGGKIYAGVILEGIHRVNEGLSDVEQGGFQSGKGVCKSNLHPTAER